MKIKKEEENLIGQLIAGIFGGTFWFLMLFFLIRRPIINKIVESQYSFESLRYFKAYSFVLIILFSIYCFFYFFSGQDDS